MQFSQLQLWKILCYRMHHHVFQYKFTEGLKEFIASIFRVKVEAIFSSNLWVDFYRTVWCHVLEYSSPWKQNCLTFKCHSPLFQYFNVILIKDRTVLENSTLEIVCIMTKYNFYIERFWAVIRVSMEWLSNILKICHCIIIRDPLCWRQRWNVSIRNEFYTPY